MIFFGTYSEKFNAEFISIELTSVFFAWLIIITMGNFFRNLFEKKLPKRQCKIVMLGLDGAGKTTILYSLKLGDVLMTIPTIGFNVEEVHFKTIQFMVWDVGGQEKLRNLWTHYFDKSKALIYVVDSSDSERVELASK